MSSDLVPASGLAKRVGRYEIESRLAFGGMAELYLAWQKGPSGFKRQVALKRILPQFASDPEFVQMFVNEALIASSLTHPNIAHIYELLHEGDDYYIVMEYVQGWTIRDVLRQMGQRKERIPLPYVVQIIAAVCDALDYAYNERGPDGTPRMVVHRDVTPTNVLVCPDGQIKLVDFGIAKALRRSENITRSRTLKGKYPYMAPEQLRGEALDHRSDIFSVGVMLHEMCTGRRLFRREGDMATIRAVLEDPIVLPSQIVPDFPADLEAVIMRAVCREREERYATAHKLASHLRRSAQVHEWNQDTRSLGRFLRALFNGEADSEDPDSLVSVVTAPSASADLQPVALVDPLPVLPTAPGSKSAEVDLLSLGLDPQSLTPAQLAHLAQLAQMAEPQTASRMPFEHKLLIVALLLAAASAVFWVLILPS